MSLGGCGCQSAEGRRAFLASLLGAITAACAGPTAAGTERRQADLGAEARRAVAGGPVVDLHAHPGAFTRARTGELPLTSLDEMMAGGVTIAFFAAVGDGLVIRREGPTIRNFRDPAPGELFDSTIGQLSRVRRRAHEGRLRLVLSPADLSAPAAEQPGALLAVEGGDPLEGDVTRVRELHALGVRSIQLMHYRINELGDIQTEPARHGGLSTRGADVVAEMNRLGLIVDGAHATPATLLDILGASRAPIIVSHTGPAAVRPLSRHLDDGLLRAVAAKGGVIGVWPLTRTGHIDGFFDEIDYVQRLVGNDAVGFGTDMAGLSTFTSIPTYREFAEVPAALLARGFSETDLRKLLGGNMQRVFQAVAR